jgi:hypothetical protein
VVLLVGHLDLVVESKGIFECVAATVPSRCGIIHRHCAYRRGLTREPTDKTGAFAITREKAQVCRSVQGRESIAIKGKSITGRILLWSA